MANWGKIQICVVITGNQPNNNMLKNIIVKQEKINRVITEPNIEQNSAGC